jgi:hypothetical protein
MCVFGAKTGRTDCQIFMKLGTYSSPLMTYGRDFDILTQGLYILRHLFVCLFVCMYKREIFENGYELIISDVPQAILE